MKNNPSNKRTLAAIDVGTNSFHLIVVEYSAATGQFRTLAREKELVRLGSGSTDMKYLSEQAMTRGIQALRLFRKIAGAFNAPIRAIATSAVREALNQDEFIRRARTEAGIKLEVASGAEEARLIYLGVVQALPVFNKKVLCIDIGGGSTEYVIGHKKKILTSNSIKLGAVRLTERFFPSGRVTDKGVKECRKYVRGMLAPIIREVGKFDYQQVIGSSGTILNLAKIVLAARGERNEQSLNNVRITAKELNAAVEQVLSYEYSEDRVRIEGLDQARADIIPAGTVIIEQTFKEFGIKTLTCSEYALREGIILDTMEKAVERPSFHHLSDIRYNSVLHLSQQFHNELKHGRQVADLALRIFDQTKKLHKLSVAEREYLEAAALLHEIGLAVSHALHHRHSYYIIKNGEMLGFTENEKEIIANVARYHRKSHPKLKHEGFRLLSAEDQTTVMKLSAILRIADGLDRTHGGKISDVRIKSIGRRVQLRIIAKKKKDLEIELWGAERKKELFEEVFRVTAVVSQPRSR
jgi:exopolyphosphatase/guanosine-5'-triphosphate,3'-diphosphate pyrophosphatase